MIERLFLGEITFKIDGFDVPLLTEKLYQSCKVISLYTKSDTLFVTVFGNRAKVVEKLCEQNNCICEVISKKGFIFTATKYFRRFGFYVGALLAAIMIFYFSNTVAKIEIIGTDNPETVAEIRSMLADSGLRAGAYIPSLNFLKLQTMLFKRCDGISWASIGGTGSVITVDVVENTPKTEHENMRIPCNIVADRDAVVVGAEVMIGRLSVLLGDAVYKGQLLVSGVDESYGGIAKYYHSYARITGRYTETVEFYQPYEEQTQTEGRTFYRRKFNFFELEIPLPSEVMPRGMNCSVRVHSVPLKLFGLTLPFGVTTEEYTELIANTRQFSTAEAMGELSRKLNNYEEGILADKKIIERSTKTEQTADGVRLIAEYTLEGEIGRVSEIYIK